MHVLVLGAGVAGMTTAHYLNRAGHDVTVVDRAPVVAAGASHANGGQLSYSFTDALARPSFIGRLPGLVLGRDPVSEISIEPSLIPWGLRFLRQCTQRRSSGNTVAVLRLAMRSAELLAELRRETGLDFEHRAAGKLVLLGDADALAAARQTTELKRQAGADVRLLSAEDAAEIEPALAAMQQPIAGAVYSAGDAVGDSRLYCESLRSRLESTGRVTVRLGVDIDRLQQNGRGVTGVETSAGAISADATVVCLGAWSPRLLKNVAVDTSIYPVRGYSVTLPPGPDAPDVSVTSLTHGMVFSRINGDMRIAGFADFGGFDTAEDDARIDRLVAAARRVAPGAADYDAGDQQRWGGFRPMRPDGRPCVGPTRVPGLYLNAGHGMLGWTLACATAADVAQSVTNGDMTH